MSQNLCLQCKNPIEPSDKFCPHCGYLVEKLQDDIQICAKCNHQNPSEVSFCENCGNSLKVTTSYKKSKNTNKLKTFKSTGNYSGEMIKGKTSKLFKTFKYIIIALVVVAIITFFIWYNTDPDASEILGNILFGAAFILVFGFVVWRKNKKGKMKASKYRETNYDYDDIDNQDDDDFDDD